MKIRSTFLFCLAYFMRALFSSKVLKRMPLRIASELMKTCRKASSLWAFMSEGKWCLSAAQIWRSADQDQKLKLRNSFKILYVPGNHIWKDKLKIILVEKEPNETMVQLANLRRTKNVQCKIRYSKEPAETILISYMLCKHTKYNSNDGAM